MSKKVLFIVSNAYGIGPHNRRTGNFLPEVAHPYAELHRAQYQIEFASLTGDAPFLDALHLANDPDNLSFLVGKGWASMQKAQAGRRGCQPVRHHLHAWRLGADGRYA